MVWLLRCRRVVSSFRFLFLWMVSVCACVCFVLSGCKFIKLVCFVPYAFLLFVCCVRFVWRSFCWFVVLQVLCLCLVCVFCFCSYVFIDCACVCLLVAVASFFEVRACVLSAGV